MTKFLYHRWKAICILVADPYQAQADGNETPTFFAFELKAPGSNVWISQWEPISFKIDSSKEKSLLDPTL